MKTNGLILCVVLMCCGPAVDSPTPEAKTDAKEPERVLRVEIEEDGAKDPLIEYTLLRKEYASYPTEEVRKKLIRTLMILAERSRKEGNMERARAYWKEILDLDPDHPEAKSRAGASLDPELSELQKHPEIQVLTALSYAQPGNSDMTVAGTTHFDILLQGKQHFGNSGIVTRLFEDAYMEVGSRLGLYPEERLKVFLYTDKEFHNISGLPPWVKGVYDGSVHLPVANLDKQDPLIKQVIYHEYTHSLIFHLTNNRCPLWLNEGLAQLMEPESRPVDLSRFVALRRQEQLPPLTARSFLQQDASTAELLYNYAYAITRFLVDTEGYWALGNFFEDLKKGTPVEKAFESAYFFPLSELEERFFMEIE